jgi:membrane-associated phospholipid phosphatase
MFAIILNTFRQTLLELDRELFTFIHGTAASANIDWLFVLLRNAITWIPLYSFVLYWIIKNYKKYAWQFVLLSLVVFAITDFTSASILKPIFMRVRPCYDTHLHITVRDLVGCGGKYGMPSSHASNHFGLASFWYFTISWMRRRKWWWLWPWAFLIGYSQVYVGKHFPGDIIVGAILGTIVGTSFAILFRRWLLKEKKV